MESKSGFHDQKIVQFWPFGDLNYSLHDLFVVTEINRGLSFNFTEYPIADLGIKIAPAQKCVSQTGNHLIDITIDFNNRNIKGTASQIIDCIQTVFFDLLAVGEQGRGLVGAEAGDRAPACQHPQAAQQAEQRAQQAAQPGPDRQDLLPRHPRAGRVRLRARRRRLDRHPEEGSAGRRPGRVSRRQSRGIKVTVILIPQID